LITAILTTSTAHRYNRHAALTYTLTTSTDDDLWNNCNR